MSSLAAATGAPLYRVQVTLEPRIDGGLRAWSDDLPELVLSHADANAVLRDLPLAVGVILSGRLGEKVDVTELKRLPTPGVDVDDAAARSREYAVGVAA